MKRLRLGKHKHAKSVKVDDEDYDRLYQFNWFDDGKTMYPMPARYVREDGQSFRVTLIKTLFPGMSKYDRVAFKNGDRLDYQRDNLNVGKLQKSALDSTTLERGAMAEAFVAFDLLKQGYHVFTPAQAYSPYDLVAADADHKLYRVQVKHARRAGNSVSVNLRGSRTNKFGNVARPLNTANIDILAVYCPDTEKVYYVKSNDLPQSVLSIWLKDTHPNPNRKRKPNMAAECEKMPKAVGTTGPVPEWSPQNGHLVDGSLRNH